MIGFGTRLEQAIDGHGRLCVGIDPHPYLLSQWGLGDDSAGLRDFGLRVVEASAGRAGIVKPQVAFFERHGSAGFAALEEVLRAARAAGLVVIADAKRGDVGSSVEAYGQAWLTPGSPLEADAMTVSAFQGVGSITAPLELAARHGKGLFVLAATSNPEAAAIQTAVIGSGACSGLTVAAGIVADVTDWNLGDPAARIASVGVVLGATVDFAAYGIDFAANGIDTAASDGRPGTPILAPGFGHQGARFDQVDAIYGAAASRTIVAASRSILAAGPSGLAAAITSHANEVGA
ncbi:MAG: orotidine-5'-phosphate decarboxylase [Microbacteriaceae bacterium]|nr:orotidine-5'-phosphate decarboxylase [Microbacteriaceae bacterium]